MLWISAAAHLLLIGGLLVVQALRFVPLPAPPPPLAVVELMLNDPGHGGAPRDRGQGNSPHAAPVPPTPAAPAAPATASPPAVQAPPRAASLAAASAPAVPAAPRAMLPPPVPAATPAATPTPTPDVAADAPATSQAAPPASAPPPAVRLGDDGDGGETDEISGPRTAPPSRDGAVRNIPPRYPRAAVLRQEQGQVVLLLHVGPAGDVTAAEIARTSGSLVLDTAAQAAALDWRFKPALKDGFPVESTLPYAITFALEGTRQPEGTHDGAREEEGR